MLNSSSSGEDQNDNEVHVDVQIYFSLLDDSADDNTILDQV